MRSFSSRAWSARRAFTLLELLVVVAILAVLATLLVPGLHHARSRAHALLCRQHLRQWGLATRLYADDHQDRLPPEGFPNPTDRHTNSGWYIQLPDTLGLPAYHSMPWRTNPHAALAASPFLCPANRRRSNGRNLFHYCLNLHVDGTSDTEEAVLLSSLPDPATLVWLFDTKNLPAVGGASFTHTNLHQSGAQFLFVDGHTTQFRARDYWDFTLQRPRTNLTRLRWNP